MRAETNLYGLRVQHGARRFHFAAHHCAAVAADGDIVAFLAVYRKDRDQNDCVSLFSVDSPDGSNVHGARCGEFEVAAGG